VKNGLRFVEAAELLLLDAVLGEELLELLLARDRGRAPQVDVGRDPAPAARAERGVDARREAGLLVGAQVHQQAFVRDRERPSGSDAQAAAKAASSMTSRGSRR